MTSHTTSSESELVSSIRALNKTIRIHFFYESMYYYHQNIRPYAKPNLILTSRSSQMLISYNANKQFYNTHNAKHKHTYNIIHIMQNIIIPIILSHIFFILFLDVPYTCDDMTTMYPRQVPVST